jgi:hypothetical protein
MTKKTTKLGKPKSCKKGCGKKQTGGWFYEEKDPYFGGVVKTIRKAHDFIKDNKILSTSAPVLGAFASALTDDPEFIQEGLKYGNKFRQAGYGLRPMRGRGTHNQPNTSSFGAVKF